MNIKCFVPPPDCAYILIINTYGSSHTIKSPEGFRHFNR